MTMLNEMQNQGEGGTKKNSDAITANAQSPDPLVPAKGADGEQADKVQDLGAPVVKGDEKTGPFKADDSTPGKNKRRADKDNAEPPKDVTKAKLVTAAYESLSALGEDNLRQRYTSILAAIEGGALVESELDLSDEVDAILGTEDDLTEDFKNKTKNLLEARVTQSIREEKTRLNELYEAQLTEEVEAVREDLTNKLDSYLSYAGTEWMKDNQLAVDSGLKAEIAESFFTGLRGLMEEHSLDIPETETDLVEKTVAANKELKEQNDSAIDTILEMKAQLELLTKERVLDTVCEGLTDTEKAKVVDLAEGVEFETVEELTEKVTNFRDHFAGTSDEEGKDASTVLSEEMIADQNLDTNDTDTEDDSTVIESSDPAITELARMMDLLPSDPFSNDQD